MATDVIPHSTPPSVEIEANIPPPNSAGLPGMVSAQQLAALPEETNYKSRLQEFAQKSAMPLPVYDTANHGPQHAPRFKSTVVVDGLVFVSPKAFTRAKAAEHDVAKYALESLTRKIQDDGRPMLDLVPAFYKAILNEFAVKISVPMPTYSTEDAGGKFPRFVSDVLFCGKTYTGQGKTKKDAEQLAARVVIENILDNSSSRIVMLHIINSKIRLSEALNQSLMIGATAGGNFLASSEDQPQTDPLAEFVHPLPDGTHGKKRRNKKKREESQPKKQRPEEQQEQESEDSQVKKQPGEKQEQDFQDFQEKKQLEEEMDPTTA